MPPRVLFEAGERAAEETRAAPAAGQLVALDERRSHHLVRVLRLAAGAAVEAFDGRGGAFAAEIDTADPRRCLLRLGEPIARAVESPLRITLAQCLSTADRMDWTIEKAVELGANAIVPLSSVRSQVRLDAPRAARKLEHWRHIIESACTQSGRALLPALSPLQPLRDFVAAASDEAAEPARRLVLDPDARMPLSLSSVARGVPLVLLVGPESGLSAEEFRAARHAGFEPVALGPRILRTETAGLAAIAALQTLAGDF
jgi:16S rRNA (uracil1498-N3)-methyltransferase